MSLASSLYVGHVYHRRLKPVSHTLRYSVFSLLLDLTEIDVIAQRFWLFSRNRFNLLGFYDRDFGESASESLAGYIHRKLHHSGIHIIPTRILLSCYPRVFGHVFNPLSLFYCLDENDKCFAVVHEVHNTFGERHAYVLPVDQIHHGDIGAHNENRDDNVGSTSAEQGACGEWIQQRVDKALFVSPFAHMGMHYEFRLNEPGERQVIVIRASDDEGLVITASYVASRELLSPSQLLKVFLRIPFLGAKVVGGIHWEALKLWVKGVPFFKHQPKRSN